MRLPTTPIPDMHRLKGVSTLVDAQGEPIAQWIKTTAPDLTPKDVIDAFKTIRRPAKITAPKGAHEADLLAVYPLGDPHIGMHAWGLESGADWDLKIAEATFLGAIEDLVKRGPRAKTALVVNLGDFFHHDNAHGHTTNGNHALDVDGRTAKVIATGIRIVTGLIDRVASHHAKVVVDTRIGNHDAHSSLFLSLALQAWYRGSRHIEIKPTITHRAYYRHGAVLIGTTHGDRAKGRDLAEIMAAEASESWGKSRHRTWLVGHVHHSRVQEHRGVRIESFRTLAARDAWHAAQGYQSGRDLHRIVYHREHGEISREIVNAEAILRLTGSGR